MSEPAPAAPRWLPWAIALGLAALIAYSTWARFTFLASSPFPLGIDGYFYPIQLRSLLETGGLYYPSSPLALYLMAPLAWLTDPIVGARLGAALGGAAVAWPTYAVGRRLGGQVGGVAAATLATASVGSTYLSVEFVKNGLGLTFGLAFVALALRALEAPSRRRVLLAVASLGAAVLTHKMGAAVALALVAPTAIATARAEGWTGRLRRGHVLGGLAACVAALAVLGVLFPERFLAGRDLRLLTDLFSSEAHWDAPAMWLRGGKYVLTMGHEALLAGVTGVLALIGVAWRGRGWPAPRRALAVTIAVLGVALALPWLAVDDPDGLGFRLRLIAYVPLALSAATLAGLLGEALPARHAPVALGVVAALALAWVASRPIDRREGVVTPDAHMIAAVGAVGAYLPPDAIVIVSERLIGFQTTYYNRAKVHLRPEPYPAERRWRLITGNYVSRHPGLADALEAARAEPTLTPPRGTHPRHVNGLVLLPEATWAWILERVPPATAARLRAWRTI